jgi:hypothetical protein
MQKALQQMNIQLPQVLAEVTGETGMAIVRAIVAGERDSVKLPQLRNARDCTEYCVNGSDENTTIKINNQLIQDFRPMR